MTKKVIRKNAKFIERDEFVLNKYKCTECGSMVYDETPNYCSQCGTKMFFEDLKC